MDKERDNLWTRRSNKLSLSTSHTAGHDKNDPFSRPYNKRYDSHGRSNPFNAVSPLPTSSIATPTSASNAFGLGSGAFASFGSAAKTPKTPGTAFDFEKAAASGDMATAPGEKKESRSTSKPPGMPAKPSRPSSIPEGKAVTSSGVRDPSVPWPLRYTWVIWYRPPTSKNSDYEKSIKPVCKISTAQDFWKVYTHLKRPSELPTVSDYHFFKEGIRPVWEDEENKKGGKWILRLKKGVADRYWEDLLLAIIGNQFAEAGEEVCGAVLSVRSGEDVFSIWTKNDGGRNVKIRETVKRCLGLPADTIIIWKSHDDSIAQRSAIDQARHEKSSHHHEKRRPTLTSEESTPAKDRSSGS
ncbi:eukaryotic translation initiation factor 4E-4 [Eremomyces bilateralis CBS 781.70]|uniref:Eukaryotic translation initiation factor 4E-4 n=1 Tax=Eremomyces bilateralis CBS 781.70 TaxID=1392243 RepID=A0A6G1FUR5_9PEZI|nr:eukaryotic translation initiation factor 4E-4 [Eremomyces bilateralis CBS 781.70]KAF1809635.1 eukaryotic translation initiation factor 4E-4 [Eremomyces bilateralis CBS 781.70]